MTEVMEGKGLPPGGMEKAEGECGKPANGCRPCRRTAGWRAEQVFAS
jgi:hypothetical protein